MRLLIFFLVLTLTTQKAIAFDLCKYNSPKEALIGTTRQQPKLLKAPNYNYQDIELRIEKRKKEKHREKYSVWYKPRCKTIKREIASTGYKVFYRKYKSYEVKKITKTSQMNIEFGTGLFYLQSNSNSSNYTANIVSSPSIYFELNSGISLSKRTKALINLNHANVSLKDAPTKSFDNKKISITNYKVGVQWYSSKKVSLYFQTGLEETLLNKASSLNSLKNYTDISPLVEIGINQRFYNYKKAFVYYDLSTDYLFTGLSGDFKKGYSINGQIYLKYYIKNSYFKASLKIKKKSFNGVYYNSDEVSNNISLLYGINF